MKKINTTNLKKTIEKLRVWIQNDGGDMFLKKIDQKTNTVIIGVTGACVGCDYFDDTFNDGIESAIKKKHPEIKIIIFEQIDSK